MVNLEILSVDQAGNHNRIVKFEQNMIFAEINKNFFLVVTGQNLADLGEGFARYYNLMVIIMFL